MPRIGNPGRRKKRASFNGSLDFLSAIILVTVLEACFLHILGGIADNSEHVTIAIVSVLLLLILVEPARVELASEGSPTRTPTV